MTGFQMIETEGAGGAAAGQGGGGTFEVLGGAFERIVGAGEATGQAGGVPSASEILDALLDRVNTAEEAVEEIEGLLETGALEPASVMLVAEFHMGFGVPFRQEPGLPAPERVGLRLALLEEELGELKTAIAAGNMIAVADALTDLQIVLDGTFLEFGLGAAKRLLVAEVHRSNMSKMGADGKPLVRDDGKILKGPEYSPPNIAAVLAEVGAPK